MKTEPDDSARLMVRVRGGDTDAFELLFNKHSKQLVNFVNRFLRNPALAEEIAQEVFLKIYAARKSYEPTAKFSTWFYRIAYHHCLNELRRREHHERFEAIDKQGRDGKDAVQLADTAAAGQENLVAYSQLNEAIASAIDRLPENQRAAFVLCRFEGLSYQEIGATLGLSESAVKSLIHRATLAVKDGISHLL